MRDTEAQRNDSHVDHGRSVSSADFIFIKKKKNHTKSSIIIVVISVGSVVVSLGL